MRKNWHSVREYQALRATISGGSTTSAARRLGLTQSAISRSISSLETRLGKTLFQRESGRLRPTDEAIQLNARLDDLFVALDQIDGENDQRQETLKLIAPPTYAHRFLVTRVASFLKANPNIFISFEIGTSDEVVTGILDNRFDLGITGVELTRTGLNLIPFRNSQTVCVMKPDHPLAKKKIIRPEDLDGQDIVALSSRHARRAQLERAIAEVGAKAHVVAETGTTVAAIEMVRAGLGLAVVSPFPAIQANEQDLAVRLFEPPLQYRTYFAVSDHRPLSRVARAFMRHVRLTTPGDSFDTALTAD
ncbi:LysR family transcriptional regulator [Pseudohalocynthiibacter aestuariivivens]|jgi:DNA-binding transcriptional LysR family regulator|uniref:LysR family transcriptional regulator n=1 Tax=Pseudohalocynthiibacter aestuariivivens TaxID=1591409 RepID=A0ABV5JBW2_9RHOB|nr:MULTISPECIES: LysR family transcriptional regulator [Pseudohalocynthiibacter]MBS9716817.1 LysR family transcriptional regulator [Pseudohalocynthiibacter aestuariivivens]MCK0102090.1 LysR family transcriptional regulator [Pseudohalocynthiibacter sp. F2068]